MSLFTFSKAGARVVGLLLLPAACVGIAFADPVISTAGIVNAASGLRPGLPGSAIAQGSLFVMYGTGLGPSQLLAASYPLQTTLAGTSISVTVNGVTTDALMVYSSATQVAALLPSTTPTGKGTITLTYNGAKSAEAKILVAASSFGTFTLSQSGNGPAVIQNFVSTSSLPLNTMIQPAIAGQVEILYGTGLGAVTFDESRPPEVKDVGNSVQLYVGGQPATVLYHGRSACCAGLDQINFVVPDGVEGCATPVALVSGAVTSNIATMSIAKPGAATCSDAVGLTAGDFAAARAKGKLTFPQLHFEDAWLSKRDYGESGFGQFYEATFDQVLSQGTGVWTGNPGFCYANTPVGPFKPLDAGAMLTLTGPSAKLAAIRSNSTSTLSFYGPWSLNEAQPSVLVEGTAKVDNGTGTASVGPFQASFTIAKSPVWTNQDAVTSIDRSQDLTVTWSGGDPNGTMLIIGNTTGGTVDADFPGGSSVFSCYAKTSDGKFTVPSWVVWKLSPTMGGSYGTLRVGSEILSPRFTATGLDVGYIELKLDSQAQPLSVQ